jgi:hypothetical protein
MHHQLRPTRTQRNFEDKDDLPFRQEDSFIFSQQVERGEGQLIYSAAVSAIQIVPCNYGVRQLVQYVTKYSVLPRRNRRRHKLKLNRNRPF